MSLSTLPLSYCTNVHPGRTVAEVRQGLAAYTAKVREQLNQPLAAGLWLANPVIEELGRQAGGAERLAEELAGQNLCCYTLNAFPFGDFHSARVKENVYVPDWTQPARLEYTTRCAEALATLMPEGIEGSISTVPLGFKAFERPADFLDRSIAQLLELAESLDDLHDSTGKVIRLAIEPEPLCVLETTAEALAFFDRLFRAAEAAGVAEIARRHLGLCYDVCHQSVEFEDVAASIARIDAAGIRINKVHITCAIEVQDPGESAAARAALANYVEPRYLHQTFARAKSGGVVHEIDLTRELALDPPPEFRDADTWRVHFHVPVNAETLGPLHTTRPDLVAALQAVAKLNYAPHLEVETYTWEVLPDGGERDLVSGLLGELTATHALLTDLRKPA